MPSKAPKQNQQQTKIFLIVFIVVIAILLMNTLVKPHEEIEKVSFSEFMAMVETPSADQMRIKEVMIKGNNQEGVNIVGTRADESKVKTFGLYDAELRKVFVANNVTISYDPPEPVSWWKTLLIQLMPMFLVLFILFIFMRQLQVGGGKAMSFGKSRAKLQNDTKPRVTFKDISGIDEAKAELEEIIEFLKEPKKFTRLGGRIPKGVLLIGPPGTGKTILARGVAGEAGVPFFSISGSDFVEMFVGVGASRVRDLFDQAKKNAPCIVFIDEIDAVGRQRGAGLGGGHDEREQTLNQLLVEMDGFESNEGVIVIAASNRADVLDPALLRPGRFDRRVMVPKPDVKGRNGILKVHSKKTPLSEDVDFMKLAQTTPGFSGADLENLVNEAALIAARQGLDVVSMKQFEVAKDKVMMGPERKTMIMSEKEKRNTSYHESGHALVGLLTEGVDPVHKVSIIPRGQALGVTVMLPDMDRLSLSKEYAEGMIDYALGGRVAEEIVFNQLTTGAGDDIKKATDIARKMVCSWGMNEKIGPIAIGTEGSDDVFLGRDFSKGRQYSEKVASDIDKEIHRIILDSHSRVTELIKKHREKLDRMAEALLIKETLTSADLKVIMEGGEIVTEQDRQDYNERVKESENWLTKVREKERQESLGDGDGQSGIDPLPQGT